MQLYLSGEHVLDIGYRGGRPDAEPITEAATGVELDYPGYDGLRLPFGDASQDAVFASHTLEHIEAWKPVLADWFRVLKTGGYLVIAVPHQHLYERKAKLPSRFNGDHKRFYTPASLLAEIEQALPVAGYRVRSLRDIDTGFSTDIPPHEHPRGCYEIELVIQKVDQPAYAAQLAGSSQAAELTRFFASMLVQANAARMAGDDDGSVAIQTVLAALPLPPFPQLKPALPPDMSALALAAIMAPLIQACPFDEASYLRQYPDIREAVEAGGLPSGHAHFLDRGYFEGRFIDTYAPFFG